MSAVALRRYETLEVLPEAAAKASPPAHAPVQPIVIDFSKNRKRPSRVAAYMPWVLMMTAGFVILGIAGFVYYGEKQGMLNFNALKPQMLQPQPKAEAPLFKPDDITLPKIDYNQLNPKVVSMMPILKRLPVGRAMEKPPRIKRGAGAPPLNVALNETPKDDILEPVPSAFVPSPDDAPALLKGPEDVKKTAKNNDPSSRFDELTDAAADNAAAGKNETAIRLYTEALALQPGDSDTAYNLAALLLQKASYYDQRSAWTEAFQIYQRALSVWGADDDMGRSIRARLEWVQNKQNPKAENVKVEEASVKPEEITTATTEVSSFFGLLGE